MSSQALYGYALRLLAQRDYYPVELQRKLEKRSAYTLDVPVSVAEIDLILSRLIELGLVSVERYIENFIRSKRNSGYGPYRIVQQLKAKGAPDNLINNQLNWEDPVWIEQATQLLQKRLRHSSREVTREMKAKHTRHLVQKGYDFNQINAAFSELERQLLRVEETESQEGLL